MDKHKEYQKKYYENNKDKIKEYQKKYYENNNDKIKEYKRNYRKKNKDKAREYQRRYRAKLKANRVIKVNNEKVCGVIYKITNKANGKSYIGQTIQSFKRRYNGETIHHVYKNTHNLHLKNAISKYGEDAFEITPILDTAKTKSELNEKELYYIKKFDCIENGYNRADTIGEYKGGKKHHLHKPIVLMNTMEYFDNTQQAERKYGVCYQNIFACCSGIQTSAGMDKDGNRLLWRYMEDVHVIYEGEELKEYVNNKINGESIYCLNDNKRFYTAKEVVDYYNLHSGAFYEHLNGKTSSCGHKNGEKLCFVREYKYLGMSEIEKDIMIKKAQIDFHLKKSWIIDTVTMDVYPTQRRLCNIFNISRPTLNTWIKKRKRFMMVTDYEEQFGEVGNMWDLVVDDSDEFDMVC